MFEAFNYICEGQMSFSDLEEGENMGRWSDDEDLKQTIQNIHDCVYQEGYDKGYEKGRADAIEECIKIQLDMSCVESCHMTDCTECMVKQMEQLKEQK